MRSKMEIKLGVKSFDVENSVASLPESMKIK